MVWNAAGTFHTRLSATALTANRKFVFPDLDGTFVVASAGAVTIDRLVLSSGNVIYGTAQANAVELALSASLTTTLSAYVVELAPGRAVVGATLIDFHAAVGTNTDFRIVRFEGVSGTAVIQQVGGGPLILDASSIQITTRLTASAIFAQTLQLGFADLIGSATAGGATRFFVDAASGSPAGSANVLLMLGARRGSAAAAGIEFVTQVGAWTAIGSDFRILRFGGLSGTAEIIQNGGGPFVISASAVNIAGAVALGSTLTVSGTAVISNLIVPGRISASNGNVVGTFSAGSLHVGTDATLHRQNAVAEGGEIRWNRAADDEIQWAMDCIGAGSATSGIVMRLFNAKGGVSLYVWDLLGRFFTDGTGSANAPYDPNGSIIGPSAAGAKFRNTCKAWVQFTIAAGTPTLNTQFNVSGVTRASSGVYAVNLANASLTTSFPFVSVTISGTAGTIVRAGGLTATQSFGIVTTVGTVATDASAVAAGAWDQ